MFLFNLVLAMCCVLWTIIFCEDAERHKGPRQTFSVGSMLAAIGFFLLNFYSFVMGAHEWIQSNRCIPGLMTF